MEKGTTAEVAERVSAAVAAADLEGMAPLLADEVTWGSCVGRDQVTAMMGQLLAARDVALTAVTHGPDKVVLEGELGPPARRTGFVMVLLIEDGRIVDLRDAADRDAALTEVRPSSPPAFAGRPAMFNDLAVILPVRDLAAALDHYALLGFEVTPYDGGTDYGFAHRGRAQLHLITVPGAEPLSSDSAAYFYVDDADALHSEWRTSGAHGQFFEPHDTPYALREGAHIDLDGNLLRYGSPLPASDRA